MLERRGKDTNFRTSWPSRLILALDQDWSKAEEWVGRLQGEIWGFKVGSVLFTEKGPECVRHIKGQGSKIFLDLKWHDIPNTVYESARRAFDSGVDWITVHASGGPAMLEKVCSLQNDSQKVLAVTALTSLKNSDLEILGVKFQEVSDWVESLVKMSYSAGVRYFVCSALELQSLRLAEKYPEAQFICPGIRFEATGSQDQNRVATPQEAFEWGANYLVLGRALTMGPDSEWSNRWQTLKSSLAEIR
jgi:orotidine-5'-phosphate decarboxylase